jgi:hypothetical protein
VHRKYSWQKLYQTKKYDRVARWLPAKIKENLSAQCKSIRSDEKKTQGD